MYESSGRNSNVPFFSVKNLFVESVWCGHAALTGVMRLAKDCGDVRGELLLTQTTSVRYVCGAAAVDNILT